MTNKIARYQFTPMNVRSYALLHKQIISTLFTYHEIDFRIYSSKRPFIFQHFIRFISVYIQHILQ